MTTDADLVDAVRRGDSEAFAEMFRRYRGDLLRYVRRILNVRAGAAEDVVQETFMRAYAGLLASDNAIRLRPWLFRIARNAAVDELRRSGRVWLEPLGADTLRDTGDADAVELRSVAHDALTLLATLPSREREVFVGHALQGATHAQLGDALGITPLASRALLYRARSRLSQAAA